MTNGMETPWGRAQHTHRYSVEVVQVSTASHGGFIVTGGSKLLIRALWPWFEPFTGHGFYEEDCDWAVVVVAMQEHFTDEQVAAAVRTLRHWLDESDRARFIEWLDGAKRTGAAEHVCNRAALHESLALV